MAIGEREVRGRSRFREIARLLLVAVASSSLIGVLILAVCLAMDRAPKYVLYRAELAFLVALEVVYAGVLAAAVAGGVLGAILVATSSTRRRGKLAAPGSSRVWPARLLLLALSIVLAAAVCEATAKRHHNQVRARSAVPVGGLDTSDVGQPSRMPDGARQVALPRIFPDPKPPREIDLVVIGESSAAGVPYGEWVSVGHLVQRSLERCYPSHRIRLVILAESGVTLEAQHRKLAYLKRRPDIVIIYCGHNEYSARFAASRTVPHYHDARPPSLAERVVAAVERYSAVCALCHAAADACRIAVPPPDNFFRDLADVPAFTPDEHNALLEDFRTRLDAITAWVDRVNALPVLVVPPANDADFEPNRSYLPADTTYTERAAFESDFRAARTIESVDPDRAAESYQRLLDRAPGFAEAHFRLATLLDRAGKSNDAYFHFVAARDLDGMPMRCPSDFQDVYRDVAARRRSILVDTQRYFHEVGTRGRLDDHLFHDGMHPSLRGQIAIAQVVVKGLIDARVLGPPESPQPATIDPDDTVRHFALIPAAWRKLALWGIMFYDKTAPARYDPSARRARQRAFADAANRIEAGVPPEAAGLPNLGIPAPVPPPRDDVVTFKKS